MIQKPAVVQVNASASYDILIGDGLIDQLGSIMRERFGTCSVGIVTDSTVDGLYGGTVRDGLKNAGFTATTCAFPAGEAHKNWQTLGQILETLAAQPLTRSDMVVALGGGVPGDVAGFASAVYARGIRFVQVPTTLLAAVDSSVGGKTAVDLRHGKNLAGAFHQPSLVVTDTGVMRNLPEALLSDGAAEIIKTGILGSENLFERMCSPDWRDALPEIIAECVTIKRDVVQQDEFDTGVRQLLNLGHTFGHAIEKRSEYSFSHGQAVAMGTAIAAGAAGSTELLRRILKANQVCGLPLRAPYEPEELAAVAASDKKRKGNAITVVLPEAPGKCRMERIPFSSLEALFRKGMSAVEAEL